MKKSLVAVLLSTLLMQACATSAEDADTPTDPAAREVAEASTSMQQHMQEVQTQMAAIKAEQNPEKRAMLMMQHMEAMKEGMAMMDHATAADTANMTMEERMEKVEERIRMVQMMIGQMMQHGGEERESAEHEHAE